MKHERTEPGPPFLLFRCDRELRVVQCLHGQNGGSRFEGRRLRDFLELHGAGVASRWEGLRSHPQVLGGVLTLPACPPRCAAISMRRGHLRRVLEVPGAACDRFENW